MILFYCSNGILIKKRKKDKLEFAFPLFSFLLFISIMCASINSMQNELFR